MGDKRVGTIVHPRPSLWGINSQALLLLPALGQVGILPPPRTPGAGCGEGVCVQTWQRDWGPVGGALVVTAACRSQVSVTGKPLPSFVTVDNQFDPLCFLFQVRVTLGLVSGGL